MLLKALIEAARLFDQMSPYLLFGFFFAGLLHIFVPIAWIARHLGRGNFTSVLKAVILGIPLPLCSCGVIPASITLRQRGASRGAVLSFLIATPITGVDSILATYGILGGVFTLFRIFAAGITALTAGMVANLVFAGESSATQTGPVLNQPSNNDFDSPTQTSWPNKLKELWRYAFGTLLGEIWKPLSLGLLIGGAITAWLPADLIDRYLHSPWLSMLVMALIGIPMYVCATGSIPIAMALMLKGLSPGAALVFLLAGPATNAVTIAVVTREMGKKAVVIYVLTIAIMSLLMGWILDQLYQQPHFSYLAHAHAHNILPLWLNTFCTALLLALILRTIVKRLKPHSDSNH